VSEPGFKDAPAQAALAVRYLFVNQPTTPRTGSLEHKWYTLPDGKHQGIPQALLEGRVTHLYMRTKQTTRGSSEVVELHLNAEGMQEAWVLQVGLGVEFTRGLLGGLLALPEDALTEPIGIEVRHGDRAALCQVHYQGRTVTQVRVGSNQELLEKVQAKFGLGNPLG